MNWREFWNGSHSIYVSDRHRLLHYEGIAKGIVALLGSPAAVVLDHGCGDALAADLVAAKCGRLYLFDAAPRVQERLRQRFAGNDRIVVLSSAALEALPDQSLDLVIANSLIQVSQPRRIRSAARLLAPAAESFGKLVLADVISPESALWRMRGRCSPSASRAASSGRPVPGWWRRSFPTTASSGMISASPAMARTICKSSSPPMALPVRGLKPTSATTSDA